MRWKPADSSGLATLCGDLELLATWCTGEEQILDFDERMDVIGKSGDQVSINVISNDTSLDENDFESMDESDTADSKDVVFMR